MSKKSGSIKKFLGDWPENLSWDGQRSREYNAEHVAGVTETWLIGKAEQAENFAMRYYKVGVGGFSRKEHHAYDHGILILHGKGEVLIGEETQAFNQGDVIYIPPDVEHQLTNTGETPMGFLCVIPARREKKGRIVWADEEIKFDQD